MTLVGMFYAGTNLKTEQISLFGVFTDWTIAEEEAIRFLEEVKSSSIVYDDAEITQEGPDFVLRGHTHNCCVKFRAVRELNTVLGKVQ